MRVLHVLKYSPPFGGGVAGHLVCLGRALRDRGDELVCLFPARQPWWSDLEAVAELYEVPEILSPVRNRFATSLLRYGNADIVHLHFSFELALALALSPRRWPPLVYHWHNPPKALMDGTGLPKRTLSGAIARFSDRRVIDVHVAISQEIEGLLVQHGWTRPEKIARIPNALLPPRDTTVPAAQPSSGVRIGTVANFRPQKDHETLLRAFAKVATRRPDARLVLVGDGPTRPGEERRARELGIEEQVEFLGIVPDPGPMVRTWDVFVLSTHYEGHPLAMLEAMQGGVPVVASAVPAVSGVIEHDREGILVRPGDPEDLADALVAVAGDPMLRKRIGTAGRLLVEREFPMQGWVDAVLDVYERVRPSP